MYKLSIPEIIEKIQKEEIFEAISDDRSFRIKIEEYNPYVCAAIHNGHNLRKKLRRNSLLSESERGYEEDPETVSFISSLPVVLEALDSRYEYDLNRPPETAVYKEEAWGKKLWKKPLSEKEVVKSLTKHHNFYKVVKALVSKNEDLFGACLVFDIHSYNYKRRTNSSPVFNIGTERIDQKKFGSYIDFWKNELLRIEIPHVETDCEINGPFKGLGYLLEFVHTHFSKSLVLATEIKKIYCDELNGEFYPSVSDALKEGMKDAILNTTKFFIRNFTEYKIAKRNDLLANTLDNAIPIVDSQLYELVKNFNLLDFVNPTNFKEEKKAFFESGYKKSPHFIYQQLNIDPFDLKRKLFNIPVEEIKDISIQALYKDTILAFADKTDMLASLGSERFLYNSYRYFGVPNRRVLKNAEFLIRCHETDRPKKTLNAEKSAKILADAVAEYNFKYEVKISKNMAARAMVNNVKKLVLISEGEMFAEKEIQALAHHEIGVHALTTHNSDLQPLKIFKVGLPLNTKTQEGLALMAEFQSGTMNISRLRQLGARVLGIDMMINGYDFHDIFDFMMSLYQADEHDAFALVTRIFRGGGFTKDYLYLDGFREILDFMQSGKDPSPLLIGKTSINYIDTITEMTERELIQKPKHLPRVFVNPISKNNTILKYIIEGIKMD